MYIVKRDKSSKKEIEAVSSFFAFVRRNAIAKHMIFR